MLEDKLIRQKDKIFSNFIELLPHSTSEIEKLILKQANFRICKLPGIKEDPTTYYGFYFVLSKKSYLKFKSHITIVEENLILKAMIIIKWFPDCKIVDLKILQEGGQAT